MFSVLVATVINGRAANFEVSFPSTPGVIELTAQCDAVLEEEARRQGGVFQPGRYQIHSDGDKWVDLLTRAQLVDRAQLFVVPSQLQPRHPAEYPMSPPPMASAASRADAPAPPGTARLPPSPPAATTPSLPSAYRPVAPSVASDVTSVLHPLAAEALHVSATRAAPHLHPAAQSALISPSDLPPPPAAAAAVSHPMPPRVLSPVHGMQIHARAHHIDPAPQLPHAAVQPPMPSQPVVQMPPYQPPPPPISPRLEVVADPLAVVHTGPMPLEEKVEQLFVKIDTNGNAVLEVDEIRTAFDVFVGVFSRMFLDGLARKIAGDSGTVNYAGWRAFCEKYPSLTDSMCLRLRMRQADAEREEHLRDEQHLLRDLTQQEQEARQALDEAASAALRSEERLAKQADVLRECLEFQKVLNMSVLDTKREVEIAQAELTAATSDVAARAAKEAELAETLADAQEATARALTQHEELHAGHMRALEEEQHATTVLSQLRSELEGVQVTVLNSMNVRDACRAAEQEALDALYEASHAVQVEAERLAAAEDMVVSVTQAESALAEAYARISAERGVHEEAYQREVQEFQQLSLQLSTAEFEHVQTARDAEELARRLDVLAMDNAAFNERRAEADRHELALLQQEFDLRAQRESLAIEEQRLQGVHAQFCAHAAIPSPRRY